MHSCSPTNNQITAHQTEKVRLVTHRRRVSGTIALLKHIYAPSCSPFSSFQRLAVDKEVLDWQAVFVMLSESLQRLKRWEGRQLPGLNPVALISCTLAAGRRWTRVDWLSSCVSGAQTGSATGKDAGTGSVLVIRWTQKVDQTADGRLLRDARLSDAGLLFKQGDCGNMGAEIRQLNELMPNFLLLMLVN